MDFKAIKTIRLIEIASVRYRVHLKYRGDYANAPCPLPVHGKSDGGISIHLPTNTWKCWSKSCGNGLNGKPGDVITFVQLMEGFGRPLEAARKLDEWYLKTGSHIENRVVQEAKYDPPSSIPESTSSKGYIKAVAVRFDELVKRLPDELEDEFWRRVKRGMMHELIQSYNNGKAGKYPRFTRGFFVGGRVLSTADRSPAFY